jgi:hypothetical protein
MRIVESLSLFWGFGGDGLISFLGHTVQAQAVRGADMLLLSHGICTRASTTRQTQNLILKLRAKNEMENAAKVY